MKKNKRFIIFSLISVLSSCSLLEDSLKSNKNSNDDNQEVTNQQTNNNSNNNTNNKQQEQGGTKTDNNNNNNNNDNNNPTPSEPVQNTYTARFYQTEKDMNNGKLFTSLVLPKNTAVAKPESIINGVDIGKLYDENNKHYYYSFKGVWICQTDGSASKKGEEFDDNKLPTVDYDIDFVASYYTAKLPELYYCTFYDHLGNKLYSKNCAYGDNPCSESIQPKMVDSDGYETNFLGWNKVKGAKTYKSDASLLDDVYGPTDFYPVYGTTKTPVFGFCTYKQSSKFTYLTNTIAEAKTNGALTVSGNTIKDINLNKFINSTTLSMSSNVYLAFYLNDSSLTKIGVWENSGKSTSVKGCGNTEANFISLPYITEVGDYGLKLNSKCTEIYAPKLTTLGSYAVGNCYLLTSFNAPLLKTIGNNAFDSCSNFKSVDLSNTKVTTIGNKAFNGCNVNNIKLPSTLTASGFPVGRSNNPFGGNSIKTIAVDSANTQMYSAKNCLYLSNNSSYDNLVLGNNGSDTVTINSGKNKKINIAEGAFSLASNIKTIKIQTNNISIEQNAFYMVSNLETIEFSGTKAQFKTACSNYSYRTIFYKTGTSIQVTLKCSDGNETITI